MSKRVHVIESDVKQRAKVARTLSNMGVPNQIYESLDELLERVPTDGLVMASDEKQSVNCKRIVNCLQSRGSYLPVVMYSGNPKPEHIVSAMLSGALDYLTYPIDADAVRSAFSKLESEAHARLTRDRKSAAAVKKVKLLTEREFQVLRWVTQGYSSKEIAKGLEISSRTVEVHRARILDRLNARSTADAVRIAIYAGVDE
ncbi:response regulator transcription factor [Sulfitobacter sp.]|uniref:response regulator transcription factor n=1 Tax=Sulfitobacter sp. TaxID=1903071 RepID=UPI004058FC9A